MNPNPPAAQDILYQELLNFDGTKKIWSSSKHGLFEKLGKTFFSQYIDTDGIIITVGTK